MNNEKDLYQLLGVERSATPEELRAAFIKLAKKYHPDQVAGNKEAEQKLMGLTSAYSILSNPEKRQAYDRGEIDHHGQATEAKGDDGVFVSPQERDAVRAVEARKVKLEQERAELLKKFSLREALARGLNFLAGQDKSQKRKPWPKDGSKPKEFIFKRGKEHWGWRIGIAIVAFNIVPFGPPLAVVGAMLAIANIPPVRKFIVRHLRAKRFGQLKAMSQGIKELNRVQEKYAEDLEARRASARQRDMAAHAAQRAEAERQKRAEMHAMMDKMFGSGAMRAGSAPEQDKTPVVDGASFKGTLAKADADGYFSLSKPAAAAQPTEPAPAAAPVVTPVAAAKAKPKMGA